MNIFKKIKFYTLIVLAITQCHHIKTINIIDFVYDRDINQVLEIIKNNKKLLFCDKLQNINIRMYIKTYYNRSGLTNPKIKVLYDNKKLNGVIFYGEDNSYGGGFILLLAVRKNFRKKGYGKKLIYQSFFDLNLKRSPILGLYKLVFLNTGINNKNAQAFYKKIGFKKMETSYDSILYCIKINFTPKLSDLNS